MRSLEKLAKLSISVKTDELDPVDEAERLVLNCPS